MIAKVVVNQLVESEATSEVNVGMVKLENDGDDDQDGIAGAEECSLAMAMVDDGEQESSESVRYD